MADNEYVSFGDVARAQLGEQCQYASRYIQGKHGSPTLGTGLRFQNLNTGSYHDILIHRDDVAEFVQRYQQERE
jgi:hypothetical protein